MFYKKKLKSASGSKRRADIWIKFGKENAITTSILMILGEALSE